MLTQNEFLHYTPSPNLLGNRIIVITGASSGIGRSAALSCARHGATVVLLGRSLPKLETVYDEIEQQGSPQPAIFPINFESAVDEDYQQLKNVLEEEFGRIDGLLINASELGKLTPLGQYPLSDWQKVMQVNINAPFMLCRTLLPLLKIAPSGRILFTSSSVAEKGKAYWGAYAASKAALRNLAETLADELEESTIKVNSINPGPTRTAMRASAYPAENPLTVTPAEDLMNRYLFLLGPDNKNCNRLHWHAQSTE